jgi:hypothetical protein
MMNIKNLPNKNLWRDINFGFAIVKLNGRYLEYFSDELKKNPEFVFQALSSRRPSSIEFADPSLFLEHDFVFKSITHGHSSIVDYLREPLISDSDFLINCINNITDVDKKMNIVNRIYKKASFELKKNIFFTKICLESDSSLLPLVPEEIRNHIKIS